METTQRFEGLLEKRKEKKRRKKRRRRLRRLIFLVILIGALAYTGVLERLVDYLRDGGADQIAGAAKYAGNQAMDLLPQARVWLADKLNYIAQFM